MKKLIRALRITLQAALGVHSPTLRRRPNWN